MGSYPTLGGLLRGTESTTRMGTRAVVAVDDGWQILLRSKSVLAKEFYLVRHGETEWNAAKRIQGQTDVPLSGEGRSQAQAVAVYLADVVFDSAHASDLSRALETAKTILAGHSSPVSLTIHRGLREISDGIYEGWSLAAAVEAEPRMAGMVDDQTSALDFAPPEGESIRQVFQRQKEVASELRADKTGHRILVVGHGWTLRLLAASLLDRGAEWFWQLEPLNTASVSVIELREGSASIVCWNQTRHLSG